MKRALTCFRRNLRGPGRVRAVFPSGLRKEALPAPPRCSVVWSWAAAGLPRRCASAYPAPRGVARKVGSIQEYQGRAAEPGRKCRARTTSRLPRGFAAGPCRWRQSSAWSDPDRRGPVSFRFRPPRSSSRQGPRSASSRPACRRATPPGPGRHRPRNRSGQMMPVGRPPAGRLTATQRSVGIDPGNTTCANAAEPQCTVPSRPEGPGISAASTKQSFARRDRACYRSTTRVFSLE